MSGSAATRGSTPSAREEVKIAGDPIWRSI